MTAVPIRTTRLLLVPGTRAILTQELAGREALAEALGAEVPPSWPPDLYDEDAVRWTLDQMARNPDHADWGFHYFLLQPAEAAGIPVAIGAGGYKGPPKEGYVEIGYSVLPEYRRRGYASEAVAGLVERACADPAVRYVVAETLPELTPSIGVLERQGFTLAGCGSEPGVIRYTFHPPAPDERKPPPGS